MARGLWRALTGLLAVLVLMPAVQAADPPAVTPQAFLPHATAVFKFGIASSQLALRKTKSEAVQGFAHQLVLEFSVAAMQLRQAVADAKLPPPRDAFDAAHKALFDELSHTAPGKPFAKAYVEAQSKALRDDTKLFEAYAQDGDNERLKYFAQEMVPLLRGQLERADRLRRADSKK